MSGISNFNFANPTRIVFGKGQIAQLPNLIPKEKAVYEIRKLDMSRVFLLSVGVARFAMERSSSLERVCTRTLRICGTW